MVFGLDDLAIMGIAASAASAGGNLLGGLLGQSGQNAANAMQAQFNANQSFQQMMFQERMRNTAYQVAMYDMKQAGLNPILAAGTGGAAVPSGSAASISPGNAGEFLGRGVSNAAQFGQRFADFQATMTQAAKDASTVPVNQTMTRLQDAQTGVAKATEAAKYQEAATSAAQAGYYVSQTGLADQNKANAAITNAILASDAMTAKSRAAITQAEQENKEKWGTGWLGSIIGDTMRSGRTIAGGVADVIKEQTRPGAPQPSPSPQRPGTFDIQPNVPGFPLEQFRR